MSRALQGQSLGVLVFVFLLAGCAGTPPADVSKTPSKQLVVLQSDDSPAFAGVTRAISEKWKGQVTVLSLNGGANADADMLRKLQRQEFPVVVAVGLRAALVARKLRGTKAIFCQVFNYEDHELVTPWMKGVSALPPMEQQFQVWKKLDPKLKQVGVISGPRLLNLVADARAAASLNGVQITHVQVRSDLETLYAFKELSPKIQALWLVPDNRVLSRNTIRDLLSYSRKQGKPVVVFNQQLLAFGGVMSVDSLHADIAEQVIARSVQALEHAGPEVPGPSIRPLTQIDLKINPIAVAQLGLAFPAELKGSAYVP